MTALGSSRRRTPLRGRLACGAALAVGIALFGSSAGAQPEGDRRVDRLEKELRELRAIVFQGRDTGQPVVVKPAGPDPAVEALQTRADQQDQTLRDLSGRVEVLGHDIEEMRRQASADHDALAELRGEVKALTEAGRPAAPPQAETAPPPDAAALTSTAPDPAAAEVAAFRAAKARLTASDYTGAADALNAYIQQYGSSPRTREANYLLGESYYARSLYSDATTAYARALRDWPKTPWAPDATVKLARALASTSRPEQACAALAEFERRYAASAPKAVRARASAGAGAAKCGG